MTEETPPPPSGDVPPADLKNIEADALGSKRMKRSFWQRVGASGLSVSIAFHVLLVFIAAVFVVSTVTDNAKKDPNAFATGAGGGSGGERVKNTDRKVQPKNVKSLAKTTTRITSKSASASIALPEMPSSASASSMVSGAMAGGSSKGFGGGSGGGIGSGKGMGSGGGKNFVSKPVMGANIFSQRLAVYFDASASMLPYLERVEAEIRDKFPDADVFLSNGVFIDVHDNEIVGGDKFKGTPYLNRSTGGGSKKNAKGEIVPTDTNPAKLTTMGRAIYKKYGENFKRGSVGGWLDILKDDQTYDALIIFSDFEDGVRQIRTKAIGNVSAYKPDKGMRADPPVVFSDRTNQGGGFARSVTLIANGGGTGQPVVQCKDTTGLIVGMVALGSGIPQGTTVTAISDNLSFTLSKPLTAAASGRVVCNNGGDRRFPEEKKWEGEWEKAFLDARENKGPRLYAISTSRSYGSKPGTIIQRCVAASEGGSIMVKFGDAKKGGTALTNLHNYNDLYVGMPVGGRGIPEGAILTAMPTFKNIPDPEDPDKKRMMSVVNKPLTISAPVLEEVTNVVFSFTPLIQAVGTLAKDSKVLDEVSGSVDLKAGMIIQDARFPVATKIVTVTPTKTSPGFFTVEMSAPATASSANALLRFRPAASTTGNSRGGAPAR
ncbi:MAG: hypothetical protein CK541_00240 [Opitutia bacterium]|nr:MAG: hypothetical protein CK541_00240 [Opitutae bacterium]